MEAAFFEGNRKSLRDKLGHGSLVVISGYGEMQHKHDCAAAFEQEASFYYLTGVREPDWWYLSDGLSGKEYLVRPDESDIKTVFDGSMSNTDARDCSGIRDIIGRDEAMRILRTWAKKHTIVYTTEQPAYLAQAGFQLNHAQAELKKVLTRTFQTVQTCTREIAQLRSIKQPEEVRAIQRAIAVTERAFLAAKETLKTAAYEYEVEAEMTRVIRSGGAWGHAYLPIVAGGINACTLHYIRNDTRLSKKELLLIDVGAQVDGYAADITRTYAIGQKPTKRHQAVHDAVRYAQQACIEQLKPGVSVAAFSDEVDVIMKQAISSLGLSVNSYRKYFPHAIGHGLGLDVHDVSSDSPVFVPGMFVTVEPGIYIVEEGIGVRIEDDILITDIGHKNLSARLDTHY